MGKFKNFIKHLTNETEQLILVTLKHRDGLHNQMRHGWRYGANILSPNGMGEPSIKRAKDYLKKVMGRDLKTRVNEDVGTKTGRRNRANATVNTHMEYARRTRTGTRRTNYKKDPKIGQVLGDVSRLQPTNAAMSARGRGAEQLHTKVADRWANKKPKLINKSGSKTDPDNRKWGKTGMSNPYKNVNLDPKIKADRKKAARGLLKVQRAGVWTAADTRRPGPGPKERQEGRRYARGYGRTKPDPNAPVTSATNYPSAKGAGGAQATRGTKGQFAKAKAPIKKRRTKELHDNILATLEQMFYDKTYG